MTDFKKLPKTRLRKMARAGDRILECYRLLGKNDANVVGEVLKGHGEFFEWDHYPPGNVYDHETHAQYYYHTHPPEGRAEKYGPEHGHFHTFLRPKGMPKSVKPAKVPDYKKPEGDNDELTHFVGISMDRAGFPIRLDLVIFFSGSRGLFPVVSDSVWHLVVRLSEIHRFFCLMNPCRILMHSFGSRCVRKLDDFTID